MPQEQDNPNGVSRSVGKGKSGLLTRKKLPWWVKWLGIPLLILGLFAAAWVSWLFKARCALNAELAAIRARGEPMRLKDVPQPDVDPDDNAARYIKKAADQYAADIHPLVKALDAKIEADGWDGVGVYMDVPLEPVLRKNYAGDLDKILTVNKGIYKSLCKARDCKQCDWELDYRTSNYNIRLPFLNGYRQLAKYLSLTAILQHEQGRDDKAIESIQTVLMIGKANDTMPFLITHLVTLGIDGLACNTLESLAPRLSIPPDDDAQRKQVKILISTLLDTKPLQEALPKGVLGERIYAYSYMEDFIQCREIAPHAFPPSMMLRKPIRILLRPVLTMDEARTLRFLTATIDAAKENNYPAVVSRTPVRPTGYSASERITHLFRSTLFFSCDRVFLFHYAGVAQRRMAAVALACRLYRVDHGKYPDKLDDLVPEYLPAVPVDPFDAAGAPLCYRADKKTPVVYSVGVNGTDDGGVLPPAGETYFNVDSPDLIYFLAGNRPREPLKKVTPATMPGRHGRTYSRRKPARKSRRRRRRPVKPTRAPATQPT